MYHPAGTAPSFLVAALKDKGFSVTQATVSRDITEMGLVKIRVDGDMVYVLPSAEAAVELGGEQRLRQLLEMRLLGGMIRESGSIERFMIDGDETDRDAGEILDSFSRRSSARRRSSCSRA